MILLQIPERRIVGLWTSDPVSLPIAASGRIRLTVQIRDADYIDPAAQLACRVLKLVNSVWRLDCGFTWVGGARIDPETGALNPMPWMRVDAASLSGQTVRVELEVPIARRVGCIMELL